MPLDVPFEDEVRLRHMLDAAREAVAFSAGRTRSELDTDRMYYRATVNCIQEIGEAANRVSDPTRATLPAVPWRQIVGMRNFIVHVYFAVKNDYVWDVVARDLGPLIDTLAEALDGGGQTG